MPEAADKPSKPTGDHGRVGMPIPELQKAIPGGAIQY